MRTVEQPQRLASILETEVRQALERVQARQQDIRVTLDALDMLRGSLHVDCNTDNNDNNSSDSNNENSSDNSNENSSDNSNGNSSDNSNENSGDNSNENSGDASNDNSSDNNETRSNLNSGGGTSQLSDNNVTTTHLVATCSQPTESNSSSDVSSSSGISSQLDSTVQHRSSSSANDSNIPDGSPDNEPTSSQESTDGTVYREHNVVSLDTGNNGLCFNYLPFNLTIVTVPYPVNMLLIIF